MLAPDHLLVRCDGINRTGPVAKLTAFAEVIDVQSIRAIGDQGHISHGITQPETGAKLPVD